MGLTLLSLLLTVGGPGCFAYDLPQLKPNSWGNKEANLQMILEKVLVSICERFLMVLYNCVLYVYHLCTIIEAVRLRPIHIDILQTIVMIF